MGSSYRDYMKDQDDQGPTWGHDTPTTKWLIITTLIVFFLQVFMTHRGQVQLPKPVQDKGRVVSFESSEEIQLVSQMRMGGLRESYIEDWFLLDADEVRSGQIWRLVTYVFCHPRENPFSLAFNMLMVWFLGSTLERMYCSREIFWFYLAAALFCGLVFMGFAFCMQLPSPLMGAGPCAAALFTLFATHYPTREILLFWVIPLQIRVALLIYVALDVFQIIQAYQRQAPWVVVAYLSGLWGIAFGYGYRRLDLNLTGFMESFNPQRLRRSLRSWKAKRRLKVFQPEPTINMSEEVDAILAKIHEQGSESLTDRERALLQKASEQAKNRL